MCPERRIIYNENNTNRKKKKILKKGKTKEAKVLLDILEMNYFDFYSYLLYANFIAAMAQFYS